MTGFATWLRGWGTPKHRPVISEWLLRDLATLCAQQHEFIDGTYCRCGVDATPGEPGYECGRCAVKRMAQEFMEKHQ